MESGHQPVINTDMRAKLIPESAGKLLSAISNNVVWYTGVVDLVFEKHAFQPW